MRITRLPTRAVMALPLAAALALTACAGSDDTAATGDSIAVDAGTDAAETETETETGTNTTEAETETAETEPVDGTEPGTDDVASDYLGSYALADDEFGTMTTVTVEGDTRTIVSNALPDHETGEFPNSGNPNTISEQDASYSYTTNPTFTGDATEARTTGVAVNGVKFEPGTAETVTCESGEMFRIEALQDTYDLGLDFNNAHVQPTGEYHYHGISELLVDAYSSEDDLVLVGFAADGFLIYASKSDVYSSSYALASDTRVGTDCAASGPGSGDAIDIEGSTPDGTYTSDWVFDETNGDLDACNGTEIDGEYAYIVTDEYPYISRCLNGEVIGEGGGPPPGGGQGEPTADGQAAPDTEG